jgi:hypothetical protein
LSDASPLVVGDHVTPELTDEQILTEAGQEARRENPPVLLDRPLAIVGLVAEILLSDLVQSPRLPRG